MPPTTAGQCDTLLDALKQCLLNSDCVLKRGLLPSECMRDHYDELPEECRTLKATLVDCKKGMWDMRKRFRGNSAANYKKKGQTTSTSTAVGTSSTEDESESS